MTYPFLHAWDASRYPAAYLRVGVSEEFVQEQLLASLAGRGAFAFPLDSGAKALRGRAVGALRRLGVRCPEALLQGRTGAGRKGLSDIAGVLPGGRGLFVEAKAPAWLEPSPKTGRLIQRRAAGEPTDEQLEFLERARRAGAAVGVAWANRDLDEILGAPARRGG